MWCLTWKSEATYNLFFQLLGADAAAVGLAVRLATEKNRLTAFHVSWLPFMLCSIVPIAIATCTVEKEYLHNISYPARLALRRRLLAEMPPVEMGRRHSAPESAAERRQAEDDLALQKERRMWIDEVMKNKPLLPPVRFSLVVFSARLQLTCLPFAVCRLLFPRSPDRLDDPLHLRLLLRPQPFPGELPRQAPPPAVQHHPRLFDGRLPPSGLLLRLPPHPHHHGCSTA